MPEWPRGIAEEMRQHLEDEYDALRGGGASHEAAMRELTGDLEALAAPPARPIEDAATDLRLALRSLRKHPGFTAVVLATLALGIGANAAIFTVVNAVLLRPLPYRDADRLMVVRGDLHRPGVNDIPTSAGEFVDYRDRSHAFEQLAVYDTIDINLTGSGEPELLSGAVTTASLFPALGATPEIGRTLQPADERPEQDRGVVIGHRLWVRRFSADPNVVGRRVLLDGLPARIVGVMPAAFQFPDATVEIWKPIVFDADAVSDNNRGSHGYTTIARLKPGVSPAQAHADLAAITATFKAEHPNNYRTGFSASLRPLRQEIVGDAARPLLILLAAVALVLLIACANVANLLLARAASRRKEIALRTALGASRGRLVRQLLTESVLIAVLGGAVGLVLASWGVHLLVGLAPDTIPRLREVGVDYRVLLFTMVVSIATGLLFGLAPALRASRGVLNDTLKEAGRSSQTMNGRMGRLLVIAEVALSLVLLVGAGLLAHSLARVNDVAPGFDASRVLTLRLALMESRYTTFEKGDAFFDELFARLRAAPAVRAVAAANALPFSGVGGSRTFHIEGRQLARPEDQPEEQLRIVTDGYFDTMKIAMKSGRSSPPETRAAHRGLPSSTRRSRASTGRAKARSANGSPFPRPNPPGTKSWVSRPTSSTAVSTRRIDRNCTCPPATAFRELDRAPDVSRHPVRGRAARTRRHGAPRGCANRSRPADLGRTDTRCADRTVAIEPVVQHGAAGAVRLPRAHACRRRHLRSARVCGHRAHPRDWPSPRSWGASA